MCKVIKWCQIWHVESEIPRPILGIYHNTSMRVPVTQGGGTGQCGKSVNQRELLIQLRNGCDRGDGWFILG